MISSRGFAAAIFAALLAPSVAAAGTYQFVPPPEIDLNRIYRIDRVTGEVAACQYGLKEGTVGVTFCYPSGEGAGPQTPGEYSLIASRHERDGGVFRVNERTGEMSVCYVYEESEPATSAKRRSEVVCTPPSR